MELASAIDSKNAKAELITGPMTSRNSIRKSPNLKPQTHKPYPKSKAIEQKFGSVPKITEVSHKKIEVSIAVAEQELNVSEVNFSTVPQSKLQSDLPSDKTTPSRSSHGKYMINPSHLLIKQSLSKIPDLVDYVEGRKIGAKSECVLTKEEIVQKLVNSKPYYRPDNKLPSLLQIPDQTIKKETLQQFIVGCQKYSVANSKIVYEGPTMQDQSILHKQQMTLVDNFIESHREKELTTSKTQLLSTRMTLKDKKKVASLSAVPVKESNPKAVSSEIAELKQKNNEPASKLINNVSKSDVMLNKLNDSPDSKHLNTLKTVLPKPKSTIASPKCGIQNQEEGGRKSKRENSCVLARPEYRSKTPKLVRRKTHSRKSDKNSNLKFVK